LTLESCIGSIRQVARVTGVHRRKGELRPPGPQC
jgi:hypothetical protein